MERSRGSEQENILLREKNNMSLPFTRAPHSAGPQVPQPEAPNAALLIDFDNVTMGMRSDLSKELKNLLNSDIIKGKVTVQRAYADWRRYPQYIVPLSENSVDLIFAPAYGSSKKNATDIRMAIDGMELVFIRPEIGTYILLTGDSDFSSLVLKLKEYGKYVIGVGIQESSSDILVQNCDEYYSYTSLTGLRKTTDSANKPLDPWVLVGEAVGKMANRNDVMRSDRLKQVMIEIDPSFDEGNFGFSKFSRFLSEAAGRKLVTLKKLENGQYEVHPADKGKGDSGRGRSHGSRGEEAGSPKTEREGSGKGKKPEPRTPPRRKKEVRESEPAQGPQETGDPLKAAYDLLRKALETLSEGNGGGPARDSDLKRKMLELESGFDEGELGFGKFSRFLRQAHDHEVVDLEKRDDGTYQVSTRGASRAAPPGDAKPTGESSPAAESRPKPPVQEDTGKEEEEPKRHAGGAAAKGLGPRTGERRGRKGQEGPPPLLEGQVVSLGGTSAPPTKGGDGVSPTRTRGGDGAPRATTGEGRGGRGSVDVGSLGLPTGKTAVIRYLTNSYKGVGQKTAESLVDAFGGDLFQVMTDAPERVTSVVPGKRAQQLLDAWNTDLDRRMSRSEPEKEPSELKRGGPRKSSSGEQEALDLEPDLQDDPAEGTKGTKGGKQGGAPPKRRTRRGSRGRSK